MTKRREKILLPLLAVLLGFILGSLIVIATGRSPVAMFAAMVKGFSGLDIINDVPWNTRYIGEFVINAMPIILTGLAFAFASRTGLFSIGAEGQLMVGSLAATAVALLCKRQGLSLALVLMASYLRGPLGASPVLKAVQRPRITVSILMNYNALHLNNSSSEHLRFPGQGKNRLFPRDRPSQVALPPVHNQGFQVELGLYTRDPGPRRFLLYHQQDNLRVFPAGGGLQ
jgi:ABC-type uncharacterized transport system permease subunit